MQALLSLLHLPLRAGLCVLRHPLLSALIAGLLAWSTITTLALFNPAIGERFNRAAASFGLATSAYLASSLASDAIDSSSRRLARVEADLALQRKQSQQLQQRLARQKQSITQLSGALERQAAELKTTGEKLRVASGELDSHQRKLASFKAEGKRLERRASQRLTKVVLADASGEVLGWVPVVGDIASMGLAAKGVYEMCQMFREIENATDRLGARYQIYTDTFCASPVEKTIDVASDTGKRLVDGVSAQISSGGEYWKYTLF